MTLTTASSTRLRQISDSAPSNSSIAAIAISRSRRRPRGSFWTGCRHRGQGGDDRTPRRLPGLASTPGQTRRPVPGRIRSLLRSRPAQLRRRSRLPSHLRPLDDVTLNKPRRERRRLRRSAGCRLGAGVASSTCQRIASQRSVARPRRSGTGPLTCTYFVAGAGFEPATSGL
jgi:hypothetical protein